MYIWAETFYSKGRTPYLKDSIFVSTWVRNSTEHEGRLNRNHTCWEDSGGEIIEITKDVSAKCITSFCVDLGGETFKKLKEVSAKIILGVCIWSEKS